MLKSLELINFQSHRSTRFDFHPGVNVLTGSSRSGKTASLRALNWCRYNKPSGTAFNSYWNRGKKKEPVDSYASIIEFDDVTVKRERSSIFNGYEVGNTRYEALGQDVPAEIEALFNMSETNIQKQFDAPFLLSESAGEVARFFNKIIRLDKIDSVLSAAQSRKVKVNQEITGNTEAQARLTKEVEAMSWVDSVEPLIEIAERRQDRIENKRREHGQLLHLIMTINMEKEALKNFPDNLDEILTLMDKAEALDNAIEKKIDEEYQIKEMLLQRRGLEKEIRRVDKQDFSRVLKLMDEAESVEKEVFEKDELAGKLDNLIRNYKRAEDEIKTQERAIAVFMNQMPDTCVYCGQPLKEVCCG